MKTIVANKRSQHIETTDELYNKNIAQLVLRAFINNSLHNTQWNGTGKQPRTQCKLPLRQRHQDNVITTRHTVLCFLQPDGTFHHDQQQQHVPTRTVYYTDWQRHL